MFVVEELN